MSHRIARARARLVAIAALALFACVVGIRPVRALDFPDRHMFVTSSSGSGSLGTWPESGSAVGIAAGDAVCRALARAAHLDNPGLYRAWLSTNSTDAYCHVQGLDGKKADKCGQESLPTAAGPWERVDGSPFGADISHLIPPDVEVYQPPRLDENGHVVHGNVWTGSFRGRLDTPTCADWTSGTAEDSGWMGITDATGTRWEFEGYTTCDATGHLYCFESGIGDPLPSIVGTGRLAFATSELGSTGDLELWPGADGNTGIAAGNAICRSLARAAGLPSPGSFKAWLSNGTIDARDRFDDDGPWMRVDRVRIANSLADLTDGFLRAPLNVTEKGRYLWDENVWTGTDGDGTAGTGRCDNWSSNHGSDQGMGGSVDAADETWTAFLSTDCDFPSSHLYCLQDLPWIFSDGFESGNRAAWDRTQP